MIMTPLQNTCQSLQLIDETPQAEIVAFQSYLDTLDLWATIKSEVAPKLNAKRKARAESFHLLEDIDSPIESTNKLDHLSPMLAIISNGNLTLEVDLTDD